MARNLIIYKCPICGNIVTLLHEGGGELVCCGQPMMLLVAGENDTASREKHVPVVTESAGIVTVTVGSVAHPMLPEHYIEFIVLVSDTGVFVEFLQPGAEPKAIFSVAENSVYDVYEYCNVHGLWKA